MHESCRGLLLNGRTSWTPHKLLKSKKRAGSQAPPSIPAARTLHQSGTFPAALQPRVLRSRSIPATPRLDGCDSSISANNLIILMVRWPHQGSSTRGITEAVGRIDPSEQLVHQRAVSKLAPTSRRSGRSARHPGRSGYRSRRRRSHQDRTNWTRIISSIIFFPLLTPLAIDPAILPVHPSLGFTVRCSWAGLRRQADERALRMPGKIESLHPARAGGAVRLITLEQAPACSSPPVPATRQGPGRFRIIRDPNSKSRKRRKTWFGCSKPR